MYRIINVVFHWFLVSYGVVVGSFQKKKTRRHLYLVLPLLHLPCTIVNSAYLGRVRYIKLFLVVLDSFFI